MPQDVPRIGGFNANVNIPRVVDTRTGTNEVLQQGINLAGSATNLAINVMEARAKIEGRRQGQKAAEGENFDPTILDRTSMTVYDQAFQQGAASIYQTRLESDTRNALTQIELEGGPPDTVSAKLSQYLEKTRESVPVDMQDMFDRTFVPMKDRIVNGSKKEFLEVERKKTRQAVVTVGESLIKSMLSQYSRTGGDAGAITDAMQSYQAQLAAARATDAIDDAELEEGMLGFEKRVYQEVQHANLSMAGDKEAYLEKFAKTQFDDKGNPLSLEETRKLHKSLLASARDMVAAKKLGDREAAVGKSHESAIKMAELDVKVQSGQATQAEIDAIKETNPSKWASLTKKLQKGRDDRTTELDSMEKVAGAIGETTFLDPTSAKDKKAVDSYYQNYVAPMMQGQDPVVAKSVLQNFVENTKIVPKNVKVQIRGGLMSGDPAAVAEAADLYARMEEAAPESVTGRDTFTKQQRAIAETVNKYVRAGSPVETAVEQAINQTKADNAAVVEQRKADFKEIAKQADKFDVAEAFDDSILPFTNPDVPMETGVEQKVRADYKALTEKWYIQTGDESTAQEMAQKELRRTWGVSTAGSKRVMKYPPEAYYGFDEDHAWIGEQLEADVGNMLGRRVAAKDVFLVPDGRTSREAGTNAPTYQIVVRDKDGLLQPVSGKRWKPDPISARKRKVEAAKEALEEKRRRQLRSEIERKNLNSFAKVLGGMN